MSQYFKDCICSGAPTNCFESGSK